MKKILILCLMIALIPGITAGCSKSEQPVQEQPLQQQSNVTPAKSLQDMVNLASEQAQKTLEKARSRAGETDKALQTNPAEVTPGMLDSLRGVSVSAETLKKNIEATGQPADAGLMDLAETVAPASEASGLSTVEETAAMGTGEAVNTTEAAAPMAVEVINTVGETAAETSTNSTSGTV